VNSVRQIEAFLLTTKNGGYQMEMKELERIERIGTKSSACFQKRFFTKLLKFMALTLAFVFLAQFNCNLFAVAQARTLEFKFAEVQPAQGIYARYENKFAKLLEERTKGSVKVAIFPGGSLGGEKDVMEGMRVGSVHMSLIGLTLMPFLDATWGPYIFRDNEHATKVLQGDIGDQWKQRVLKESGGLRLLDYVYFGPRQLTTKNTPVHKLEDLKGLKIRVMEAPIYLATWRALGANPVPMAWPEVFTGLQQGTIDAQENPYEVILSQSLFEVQNYVMATAHVRPFRFLLMSDRAYNLMSKEEQKIFMKTWREISKEIEQEYISKDNEYIATLKSKGMKFIQPDTKDFMAVTEKVRKEFLPKAWGKGVYEKIKAIK
jgi:tripartite ATP-independent transporter DctP family solute receptor